MSPVNSLGYIFAGIFMKLYLKENIRALIKARHITQADLERVIGISNKTMNRWDRNMPSIDKVVSVADYFHVGLDELVGRDFDSSLSRDQRQLLDLFDRLNDEGKTAALAMITGLSCQPEYIKSDSVIKMEV